MNIQLDAVPFESLSLEDLYTILKLRTDIFVVEQECPYPELDGLDAAASHVILRIDKHISAYARIHYFTDYAKISRVLVRKTQRKKGLAKLLMLYCLDEIARTRTERMTIKLSAQCYLMGFYESLGFQTTGEDYLEDGIPHVDMKL